MGLLSLPVMSPSVLVKVLNKILTRKRYNGIKKGKRERKEMSLKCSNLGCFDNATWTVVIETSVDAADKYRPVYGTQTFCNKHKKLLEKIRPDYYKFREL